ncbi:hypothetical protein METBISCDRAFT_28845 [Metschnikowia bicuspidata]|uniref:Uncharacterized protein n=1 Tax=Metschnikowia bicuspidata TaxID=27322 RepID=A0A4P9Z9P2_9ASCO|nr:hypothetical protein METBISCDRAFT_28845 [Metschnikowia bicuspidata]
MSYRSLPHARCSTGGLHSLQAQTGDWAELVDVHTQCQATLRKQGHALSDEWVHTERDLASN